MTGFRTFSIKAIIFFTFLKIPWAMLLLDKSQSNIPQSRFFYSLDCSTQTEKKQTLGEKDWGWHLYVNTTFVLQNNYPCWDVCGREPIQILTLTTCRSIGVTAQKLSFLLRNYYISWNFSFFFFNIKHSGIIVALMFQTEE